MGFAKTALDLFYKTFGRRILKNAADNKIKQQKVDIDKEIPTNIKIWRDAIRAKATEMENAIDAASSVDDIAKLWITYKVDDVGRIVKSGILYDWPELES